MPAATRSRGGRGSGRGRRRTGCTTSRRRRAVTGRRRRLRCRLLRRLRCRRLRRLCLLVVPDLEHPPRIDLATASLISRMPVPSRFATCGTPFAPKRSARTPTRMTISQIPSPNGIDGDATRVGDRCRVAARSLGRGIRSERERCHREQTPMRLLNRTPPRQADAELTYFSVSEANDFRRLVERSFAAAGREVTVFPDRVEDRSGTTFRLWNIGALCVGASPSDWPALVDDHVRLVTTPTRELSDSRRRRSSRASPCASSRRCRCATPTCWAMRGSSRRGCWRCCRSTFRTPSRRRRARSSPNGGRSATCSSADGRTFEDCCAIRVSSPRPWGRARAAASPRSPGAPSSPPASRCCWPRPLSTSRTRTTGVAGSSSPSRTRHQLLWRPIDRADASFALDRMIEAALRGFAAGAGPLSPMLTGCATAPGSRARRTRAGGKARVLRDTGLRELLKSL